MNKKYTRRDNVKEMTQEKIDSYPKLIGIFVEGMSVSNPDYSADIDKLLHDSCGHTEKYKFSNDTRVEATFHKDGKNPEMVTFFDFNYQADSSNFNFEYDEGRETRRNVFFYENGDLIKSYEKYPSSSFLHDEVFYIGAGNNPENPKLLAITKRQVEAIFQQGISSICQKAGVDSTNVLRGLAALGKSQNDPK